MRKWFFFGAIVLSLLIAAFFGLSYYGVRIIEAQLQKRVGPGLTINRIKVHLTSLSALGIRYQDPSTRQVLLDVEEIRIFPDVFSLLKGGLWIREVSIRNPFFWVYRSREGRFTGPWIDLGRDGKVEPPGPVQKEAPGSIPAKKGFPDDERPSGGPDEGERGRPGFLQVRMGRLRIENGSIDFEDRKAPNEPGRIRLRGIQFDVRDLQYPVVSRRSELRFQGRWKGEKKDGRIEARGWIDLKTFDMEVPIQIEEVEVKALEPYYRRKVTAEIVGGSIDLDLKLLVQGRKIDAPGEVRLANLQLGKGEGMIFYFPAKLLLMLLQSKGNELRARFRVKGNLDDPRFDLEESFLTRMGLSLAESLGLPIKGVGEELVGGSIKGTEGLVEGMKAIGEILQRRRKGQKE